MICDRIIIMLNFYYAHYSVLSLLLQTTPITTVFSLKIVKKLNLLLEQLTKDGTLIYICYKKHITTLYKFTAGIGFAVLRITTRFFFILITNNDKSKSKVSLVFVKELS